MVSVIRPTTHAATRCGAGGTEILARQFSAGVPNDSIRYEVGGILAGAQLRNGADACLVHAACLGPQMNLSAAGVARSSIKR